MALFVVLSLALRYEKVEGDDNSFASSNPDMDNVLEKTLDHRDVTARRARMDFILTYLGHRICFAGT